MAAKKSRELYAFDIEVEETTLKDVEVEREVEVEKEVEVERKRKNKKTGKFEKKLIKEIRKTKEKKTVIEQREQTEATPIRIVLRRPTRTQLEDGDMFYSIQLNKFIKMGLLTRAMLAKQHVDVGGTLDEEEKQRYAQLYVQLYERQQAVQRYALKTVDEMSDGDTERLNKAIADLGLIRKELTDFETVQASMFEHTADIKARNKTITWYLMMLSHLRREEDGDEDLEPIFHGEDFDAKYDHYKELEEDEDEIYFKCIDKLSSLVTIWYMSGVQTQEDFDALLEEVNQEMAADVE
jgi:hypothetical protein